MDIERNVVLPRKKVKKLLLSWNAHATPAKPMDHQADLELEASVTRLQAVCRGRQTRVQQQAREDISDAQKQKLTAAKNVGADAQRMFYKEVHEVLGVSRDTYNALPGLRKAHEYLEKHQLKRVMDSLLARAVLERPPDLREFLRKCIHEMQEDIKLQREPGMGPFTDEDLQTMFRMWDEFEIGKIPVSKVAETLKALSCSPGREAEAAQDAAGAEVDEVDEQLFMSIVRSELEKVFAAPEL